MVFESGGRKLLTSGLSARLLVLTIFFVMLTEIFIYAPSIGRYRMVYMEERIAAAHLASLAMEAPPERVVSDRLLSELLAHARSHGIVLRRPASKAMMLSRDMPLSIAATYDLRDHRFFPLIWKALLVLSRDGSRFVRVVAPSPRNPEILVETIIDEAPLRAEMWDYSARILMLSILISLVTASLVFLSLRWLFVRPMLDITQSMVRFRDDPEDGGRVIRPSTRSDEIGRAERELHSLQTGLRNSLQQRAHLAALGSAVTRINHDLRNILATAQIVSDRLGAIENDEIKRIAPGLTAAIDRAVELCGQTLQYAHDGTPEPEYGNFSIAALIDEVATEMIGARGGTENGQFVCENQLDGALMIEADRSQLFRVLSNLILNAVNAGASRVTITGARDGNTITMDVADDGPGIPAQIRERLFQPFSASGRAGGTGLGLAIARDLMRGHGGDIVLAATENTGAVFHLTLPADRQRARGPGLGPD
jgi:signal transduction histidine kinase